MISKDDLGRLIGADVYDRSGTKIGPVREVFVNAATGEPEWVTVRTGSLRFQESFVPLAGARLTGNDLTVAADELHVKATPVIDTDRPLDPDVADRLRAHYGLPVDEAMTRSEERLNVGKRREPIGKVRLRKYVVTEEQQVTVPVRREEVRLEQVPPGEEPVPPGEEPVPPGEEPVPPGEEPVPPGEEPVPPGEEPVPPGDDEASGGPLTLHAERPVVRTETVPVEQVRLTKDTVLEQRTVSGTVRREQIDYEQEKTPASRSQRTGSSVSPRDRHQSQ